jgi:hypothetical protein
MYTDRNRGPLPTVTGQYATAITREQIGGMARFLAAHIGCSVIGIESVNAPSKASSTWNATVAAPPVGHPHRPAAACHGRASAAHRGVVAEEVSG